MSTNKITKEELESMDSVYITAQVASRVIGCDPQALRIQAREHPETLGFGVFCLNNDVRIPRVPFIRFWFGA